MNIKNHIITEEGKSNKIIELPRIIKLSNLISNLKNSMKNICNIEKKINLVNSNFFGKFIYYSNSYCNVKYYDNFFLKGLKDFLSPTLLVVVILLNNMYIKNSAYYKDFMMELDFKLSAVNLKDTKKKEKFIDKLKKCVSEKSEKYKFSNKLIENFNNNQISLNTPDTSYLKIIFQIFVPIFVCIFSSETFSLLRYITVGAVISGGLAGNITSLKSDLITFLSSELKISEQQISIEILSKFFWITAVLSALMYFFAGAYNIDLLKNLQFTKKRRKVNNGKFIN